MQPQANRERIIIRTSLSPKLPPVVADARSVRQIVLNLLSNSIKFTGAGGQVIVSTALTDRGEVVLRVRDTGIGMSEQDIADRARAVPPARDLRTRFGSGGTGLGLPLTKALAEANRAAFHDQERAQCGDAGRDHVPGDAGAGRMKRLTRFSRQISREQICGPAIAKCARTAARVIALGVVEPYRGGGDGFIAYETLRGDDMIRVIGGRWADAIARCCSFWQGPARARRRTRRSPAGVRGGRLAQHRCAEVPAPALRLRGGDQQPARHRGNPLGWQRPHRGLLRRVVGRHLAEAGDRLDGDPRRASARRFSDGIVEAPRSFADRTSISAGIDFAMTQLDKAPFESPRRTIDVSGDGTNNAGRDVTPARDEALAKGVTINGLVILSETPLPWNPEHTNPPGGLGEYYRRNVIGGPGAFVMVAENFNSFGQAIINKLIAEIADNGTSRRHAGLR